MLFWKTGPSKYENSIDMKFKLKNILVLGLAISLASCAEIAPEDQGLYGTLAVPHVDIDVSVQDLNADATKGSAPADKDAPSLNLTVDQLTFTVTDCNDVEQYSRQGLWTDPLTMPVGDYTISVSYGSDPYAGPVLRAEYNGTIKALTNESPSLNIGISNALLYVYLTDELELHLSGATATVNGHNIPLGEYVYVPSAEELTLSVNAGFLGETKTVSQNISARAASTYTVVGIGLSGSPSITLNSDPHEYGAWGSVAYMPKYASANGVSEANQAKIVYYAYSSADCSGSPVATGVLHDYGSGQNIKFSGLTTGSTYYLRAELGALKSDVKELTVEAFPALAASGNSSYDLYKAGNIEAANACEPGTITEIGFFDDNLDSKIKQAKFGYGGLQSLTFDGTEVANNHTATNVAKGEHTVLATVKILDEVITLEKRTVITGLPFTPQVPTAAMFTGNDKYSFKSEYIQLGGTGSVAGNDNSFKFKEDFYLGSGMEIGVTLNINVLVHAEKSWSGIQNTKCEVISLPDNTTRLSVGGNEKEESFPNLTWTGALSSNVKNFKFRSTASTGIYAYTRTYSVGLLYR